MTRFAFTPYFADDRVSADPSRAGVVSARASANVLAGMLLAALVAAMLVVADQVITTWADGHLLVAWVALWSVVFAGMALLAPFMRQMAQGVARAVTARLLEREQARTEETLWELARYDHRVLAEIRMAQLRQQEGL